MKKKPLPVGIEDFERLITEGYYFIDKSMLIKELLDKKGAVTLFTRPRRFGKTLNMSMIRYFFEDMRNTAGEKTDNAYLFQGLRIMQCGTEYLQHLGKYPVISLSLKSAKQLTFESAYAMLAKAISSEFRRHRFILDAPCLKEDKEHFLALMHGQADYNDYCDSLLFLSECLSNYYGRRAILLIDEYDVPLESAYFNQYYEEMLGFIRSLFESVLKTNPYLEFAVVTGCLRISKESIFTGLNNLEIISVLSKNYDEYFGFTEEEVKEICRDYAIPEKYDLLKEWYDGYRFGNANVYNPWSVIRYVKDLLADNNELPSPYWANTSSNSIVRHLIEQADGAVKEELELLIEGKTVEKPIHEDITYDEVYKNKDNLWSFMLFTGYFRKEEERFDEMAGTKYIGLSIPNKEVGYIFRNKVLSWFREQIQERNRSRLFEAFVALDAALVKEELEAMLLAAISFNDAYENFYHGFLAGILYGMEGYLVKSNREGGTGRTDLFVKPVSREKTAYVVELKVAEKFMQLSEKAGEALAQIEDRKYAMELRDDGYASIAYYGIAFFRKNCEVKTFKME